MKDVFQFLASAPDDRAISIVADGDRKVIRLSMSDDKNLAVHEWPLKEINCLKDCGEYFEDLLSWLVYQLEYLEDEE